MSIVNLFLNKAPSIAGLAFDAVLENTLEGSVTVTGYTIETGARAADHRVINPIKWSLIVGVSNNPLRTQLTDFIGALTDNDTNGLLSTVAGLSAGFLAGSNGTRSSAALESLFTLMLTEEPFSIDAVDVQLNNMVITNITRTHDLSTEGGLIAQVELQEFPFLRTELTANEPTLDTLRFGDPAYTQAVARANKGEVVALATNASRALLVGNLI